MFSVAEWSKLAVTVVYVVIATLCKEQGITVVGVCAVHEILLTQRVSVTCRTFSRCVRTSNIIETSGFAEFLQLVAFQLRLPEALQILASFVRGKPHFPSRLRRALLRVGFLLGTTAALMMLRIKVMDAQLPVFTK